MNNRVCHITSAHDRYDIRIFHKECKSLAKYGFDVTLLVNDDGEDEFVDDIKIISTHFNPKNRYERMIISQKRIKEIATEIDADIYHFHDPELLALASYLKRRGKKVIFDFHEDVSQQILFKTWIPRNLRKIVSCLYKLYESRKAKKFDALITVTPKFVEKFKKINPNTTMVTNYPVLSEYEENSERRKSKSICFAGSISSQWNHINIINAIEQIDDISYILAGNGSKEYLSALENLVGWEKVNYYGKIPHEEVKEIYSKSIAGMALLSYDTQVGDEGTLGNTKIFEFMEAGLPIICSNNRLWKEIVDKYQCGIVVAPNDIQGITNAITKLITHPTLAMRMGKNGRKITEEIFNWRLQFKNLYELYLKLLVSSE